MPFREAFDCLWCGTSHQVRTADDIEGWAGLCPECLGKAQDNGFLRMRLRTALRQRSEAATGVGGNTGAGSTPASGDVAAADADAAIAVADASAPAHDDFYLRRGRFSRGPLHDGPWTMELDGVTRWLDEAVDGGTIVELGAGTGWWSALLAEKGELWMYDEDDSALELARGRLVSHGLRAHLHQRPSTAEPERTVDVVVGAYVLGRTLEPPAVALQADVIRRWLRPGGRFVFVEAGPAAADADGIVDGPGGEVRVRAAGDLDALLIRAGFASASTSATANGAFLVGTATAP